MENRESNSHSSHHNHDRRHRRLAKYLGHVSPSSNSVLVGLSLWVVVFAFFAQYWSERDAIVRDTYVDPLQQHQLVYDDAWLEWPEERVGQVAQAVVLGALAKKAFWATRGSQAVVVLAEDRPAVLPVGSSAGILQHSLSEALSRGKAGDGEEGVPAAQVTLLRLSDSAGVESPPAILIFMMVPNAPPNALHFWLSTAHHRNMLPERLVLWGPAVAEVEARALLQTALSKLYVLESVDWLYVDHNIHDSIKREVDQDTSGSLEPKKPSFFLLVASFVN